MADSTLRRWVRELTGRRRELKGVRKRERRVVKRIGRLRVSITRRRRNLAAATAGAAGARAVDFLMDRAGWHETGSSNDSEFLGGWRERFDMPWMRGQPWCGLAVMAAWSYGAGKSLPQDTVSTVAILNRARSGNGFKAVRSTDAKPGDLVVFNYPGGAAAEHVGLARGPARNGLIPTVEGNTSPGSGGSQNNGGGIWPRSRPVGLIAVVARPI